ncbi:putative organic cation transporter protein-like [Apostichopus japonicus]|uniref:Putative organic cation transporter protein-like n=1 Tax=Stichopus japonicus TaxID=307972 RepID=A0A2G8JTL5_STIJA|nr:putative organic cation transporter protein-like [Apostichopus japonicus]
MIGAFGFGMLADRYGRKLVLFFSLVLYDVASLVTSVSPNYAFFLVVRFFAGIAQMGIWGCLNSLVSEFMIPKYRNIAMTIPLFFASIGLMIMAGLAFLIRDWRYLQLAITAPVVVATFGVWFLPESLRWLISNNKTKEANLLIERLAKINGKDVPTDIYQQDDVIKTKHISTVSGDTFPLNRYNNNQEQNNKTLPDDVIFNETHLEGGVKGETGQAVLETDIKNSEKSNENFEGANKDVVKNTYLDLFKPPVLHVTIVIIILRFTVSVVYFGFALSTGRLSGDPYLNFFYSALVEIPAKILSPFLYNWFRRTYIVSFCTFMCFAVLTTMAFIPAETKNGADLGTLTVVLALMGKFFVSLTIVGLLLLTMELFPTPMRNMGNGLTLCVGRIGAILAPFMLYADNFVEDFSAILMAVLSLTTAVSILTLPDTRSTPQPQTTEDLRQIMNSSKRKKSEKKGQDNEAYDSNSDSI